MKEFVANKIYIDEIPLRFLGMQLGTRMTIIRMKNNIRNNKFRSKINKIFNKHKK